MPLTTADYILIGFAGAAVVLGAFRGLSGTLALLVAFAASAASARFGWPYLAGLSLPCGAWLKVLAIVVVTLVVFGFVRIIVARTVRFLLAQPMDALLGAVSGLAIVLLVVYVWAFLGTRIYADFPAFTDCSNFVRLFAAYVG
ncbi:MAG: CvpA family protein [Kiritimatiellia bacterium]